MTDEQADMSIERVRVLHGHTSPETAYVVDDYPYGRVLRCKIRYWIETGETGATKGHQRFVSQTTNPKLSVEKWNNPKRSTYNLITAMYLDCKDHVQIWGASYYLTPEQDARTRLMGIYDQLSARDRAKYDVLLDRAISTRLWHEWEERIHALTLAIQQTGEIPEIVNGQWNSSERVHYIGTDPAAYIAVARQRVQQL